MDAQTSVSSGNKHTVLSIAIHDEDINLTYMTKRQTFSLYD